MEVGANVWIRDVEQSWVSSTIVQKVVSNILLQNSEYFEVLRKIYVEMYMHMYILMYIWISTCMNIC